MEDLPGWAIDDPTIDGEVRLLRRVPRFMVHEGVIEKSNFRETEIGRGLSMTVWASPSDLDDVRRFNEDFGIVCVEATALRSVGALIARVPLIGNLNHCEIFPHFKTGSTKKLKAASRWVYYPDWVEAQHRGELEQFN